MQLSTHIYQNKLISPAKHTVITHVLLGIKPKSVIRTYLAFSSEPCHHFHHDLVSLRRKGNAAVAIEIFLVVQTDVADERFLQTQSDTASETGTLVVVHCQFAHLVCLAVEIALAVAVVAHIVVAQTETPLPTFKSDNNTRFALALCTIGILLFGVCSCVYDWLAQAAGM